MFVSLIPTKMFEERLISVVVSHGTVSLDIEFLTLVLCTSLYAPNHS